MTMSLKSLDWNSGNSFADSPRQQRRDDSKLASDSFLSVPIKTSSLVLMEFSEKNLVMYSMLVILHSPAHAQVV